jgi:hypothetical protein
MKRKAVLIISAVVVLSLTGCPLIDRVSGRATIEIQNLLSTRAVKEVYLIPASQAGRGTNQLDTPLAPGSSVSLKLDAPQFRQKLPGIVVNTKALPPAATEPTSATVLIYLDECASNDQGGCNNFPDSDYIGGNRSNTLVTVNVTNLYAGGKATILLSKPLSSSYTIRADVP